MELVITDVTRFHDPDKVCVAGISEQGNCLRPLDYFSIHECKKYNIVPGSVIKGDFFPILNAQPPHTEDHEKSNIHFSRYTSVVEFFNILNNDAKASIEEGFNVDLSNDRKCIPQNNPPIKSIITIKADPSKLNIVQSQYDNKSVRVSFVDGSHVEYRFMPLTDKYLYDYIYSADISQQMMFVNKLIQSQKHVFLRIGLGRVHPVGDRIGYWIQVNGVCTFPQWIKEARLHSKT